MKHFFSFSFIFLLYTVAASQPNTEVYLMSIEEKGDSLEVTNFKNISNRPGYDNQPAFVSNDKLVYAGTENDNTEIILYYLESDGQHRLNAPTAGGEYSPKPFPTQNRVAAVRLDTTGLQRLYSYDYANPGFGRWKMLFEELEVAYYAFHDDHRIIASVLAGDRLDLFIGDIKKDEAYFYIDNVGRSIHKVPGSNSISYTLINEDGNHDVYLLNIDEDGESFFVCTLPVGIQDHIWLSSSQLLLGSGNKLYMMDLFKSNEWVEVADLSKYDISEITRMSVSPDNKHLAIVAEKRQIPPGEIVNAHIAPFNDKQLDSFVNAFAKDVVVRRFPSDTLYKGRNRLKRNYARFFKNNESWNVSVINRIVFKGVVIDEEEVMVNGKLNKQVTIYETKDNLIQSMTFIQNDKSEYPLSPIIEQMKAYNDRDIDAFMNAYSKNIKIYNYPNELQTSGKKAMREGYASYFENIPDLKYTVTQRMVIGNIIIDEEHITANGKQFSAVAIYEITDSKISKVIFIQ